MTKPLRALLLAAGLGTRLRPITNDTPKCLVPINGKPLLEHWLRKLERLGCDAVLINTHYLADKVMSFLDGWESKSLAIKTIHEPSLLGTAGTLLENKLFFKSCTGLLIHADNVMGSDMKAFLKKHEKRNKHCILTMLTFTTRNPTECGIVEINNDGVVVEFYEKVKYPPTDRANGAVYAFDSDFLDHLGNIRPKPTDFSNEVVPTLMNRIQTQHTNEPYIDIGTPTALAEAQAIWNTKK